MSQHCVQQLLQNLLKTGCSLRKNQTQLIPQSHTSMLYSQTQLENFLCPISPHPPWRFLEFLVHHHRHHHLHHSLLAAQTHSWCECKGPIIYMQLGTLGFQAGQKGEGWLFFLFNQSINQSSHIILSHVQNSEKMLYI